MMLDICVVLTICGRLCYVRSSDDCRPQSVSVCVCINYWSIYVLKTIDAFDRNINTIEN